MSSAPTPPTGPAGEIARAAAAHVDAALAVLLDPVAEPEHAGVHLLRAWQVLAGAPSEDAPPPAEGDDDRASAGRPEDLAARLRAGQPPWLAPSRRDEVARLLEQLARVEQDGDLAAAPTRRALIGHARWLRRRVDPRRPAARRRLLARTAMALVVLVPTVAYLLASADAEADRPWYGRYYHNAGFRGDPWTAWDRDVRFDWQEQGPFEGFRKDGFTARWDGCLVLDEPAAVLLQLTSDDGSRLLVDGQALIDDLDRSGSGTQPATVTLAAGVHPVRVEYREKDGSAHVALTASFDGTVPRPIPRALLRPPATPFDDEAPCRHVR